MAELPKGEVNKMKLNHKIRMSLIFMLFTIAVYYKDESILKLLGLHINGVEEEIFDDITLFILLLLFFNVFFLQEKVSKYLQKSREQYRCLIGHSAQPIFVRSEGEFIFVNRACANLLGASHFQELLEKPWMDIIHPDSIETVKEVLLRQQKDKDEVSKYELKVIRFDGKIIHVEVISTPIEYMGKDARELVVLDITQRKQHEELMNHLIYHDQLTGLPNRRFFQETLNQKLDQFKSEKLLAVMFIDLDGFKNVNDTFGHEIGDQLLQEVAKRLNNSVRDRDMAARLAGDEFTVILPEITREDVVQVAERVLEELRLPVILKKNSVKVTSSIGIVFYPHHGDNVETLLKHADQAMYQAKKQGKNNYLIYTGE
ncbi:diguanylate cyclase domain-containing protein [Bacillus songklensis]|uniref:Diguanylate cyclase domain-containing protein n=1 Tax=Bacillus songklensis TaxID=1069116 RepID=A0ABV8AXG8_9BACI